MRLLWLRVVVLRYLLFRYHGVDGDGRLGKWLLLRVTHGSDSDIHRVPADPQTVNLSPTVLPNLSLTPYDRDRGSHPTIAPIPHYRML